MIQSKPSQMLKGAAKTAAPFLFTEGLPGCPGASHTSIFFFRDRIRRKNR